MPGNILVIDPIVTNRVVLKAQLVAEFFTVELADDMASARRKMAKLLPDILILNYETEEISGFATCKAIRTDPRIAHLPIVMLCCRVEDSFWGNAYRLGIEEVIPFMPKGRLLATRLAQMLRRKEIVENQRMRHRTYADMGFAEGQVDFPPRFSALLTIDCGNALRVVTGSRVGTLENLLKQSFAHISIEQSRPQKPVIQIIDEAQVGHGQALKLLCDLQSRRGSNSSSKILYISQNDSLSNHRRALELGADDFIAFPYCDAELASRLRRLAWLYEIEKQAEKMVDDRLRLAMLDSMTGLHNRRYAMQYLQNIAQKQGPAAQSITVMMLDLDRFKLINDTYGHQAGDAVICETANRLTQNLRNADLVARIGGEEFLVVLSDTPMAQAQKIANRMCAQINASPFQMDGNLPPIEVSISIGVAFADTHQCDIEGLIKQADRALYQSKGTGRNRVTLLPMAA